MSDAPDQSRTVIAGVAVPFDYVSVDTDAMFPVSSEGDAARDGWGAALFGRWRTDPDFILNRPEYAEAQILVAGPQFGIGSSRETAVWALRGAGFRAVLAPSFGEIFRTNCVRNGVLTGVVAQPGIDRLQAWLRAHSGACLRIDLERGIVNEESDEMSETMAIGGFARRCLLEGIDEFELLSRARDGIEQTLETSRAWTPAITAAGLGEPGA